MISSKNIESVFLASIDEACAQLCDGYRLIKKILLDNFYDWVQASCPFFTDHGRNHVQSVINTTSRMLEDTANTDNSSFTSVETFLLLSGILWHDVAMVHGRSGHASRVKDVMSKFRNSFPNPDFARIVYEIAKSHSGTTGLKIPRAEEFLSLGNETHQVHPRRLAAILRFADEISENRSRISYHLIDSVPDKNRIFWEYANAITSSRPDVENDRVVIAYSIEKSVVTQRFPCVEFPTRVDLDGTISLIEYIVCRLEKVNNERIYCSQFSLPFIGFSEVQAEITIVNDLERLADYDALVFTFRDGGLYKPGEYPNTDIFDLFFKENSNWRPDQLSKALA